MLKAHKVEFTGHPYEYVEHGGTAAQRACLGWRNTMSSRPW